MGLFERFKKDKTPKHERQKKCFEDVFGELQTDMVAICNEYAEGLADKIYIHCYITDEAYAADHFYEVNGDIIPKHKLGEQTNGAVDTSPDRQKQCGKILMDDLTQIIHVFKDDNRRMPYELRIVYDAKKNSMDAHYEYPPIPDELEELLPNEIMKLWMDELKSCSVNK